MPPWVALLRGRVETACWALRSPQAASQGRDERRGPCTMASTNHTEPWAQMDRQGPLIPECPQEARGPSWTDGGRSHPSVHTALGPSWTDGATHTRVSTQLAESSGAASVCVLWFCLLHKDFTAGLGFHFAVLFCDVVSPASHTPGWMWGAGSCGSDRQSPASTQLPAQTFSTDTPSSPVSSACLEKRPQCPRGVQGPTGPASSGRWVL